MNSHRVYDVFTRLKHGDDLILIGSVQAETDRLAKVYAAMTYSEENWTEMRIAPRDQIIFVKPDDKLPERKGE